MRSSLATIGAAALFAVLALGVATASAAAPRTCTWGGTLVAATGKNEVSSPGLTNTPSTQPLHFHATGPLGSQCEGTLVFDGLMDAGASCSYITFHARAYGIPGVASVAGTAVAGFAPARLYDRHGRMVGSENANFLSDPKIVAECNSPQGVRENPFSSLIELLGDWGAR